MKKEDNGGLDSKRGCSGVCVHVGENAKCLSLPIYVLTSIIIKYSDGGTWVWRQLHNRCKVEIKLCVILFPMYGAITDMNRAGKYFTQQYLSNG